MLCLRTELPLLSRSAPRTWAGLKAGRTGYPGGPGRGSNYNSGCCGIFRIFVTTIEYSSVGIFLQQPIHLHDHLFTLSLLSLSCPLQGASRLPVVTSGALCACALNL